MGAFSVFSKQHPKGGGKRSKIRKHFTRAYRIGQRTPIAIPISFFLNEPLSIPVYFSMSYAVSKQMLRSSLVKSADVAFFTHVMSLLGDTSCFSAGKRLICADFHEYPVDSGKKTPNPQEKTNRFLFLSKAAVTYPTAMQTPLSVLP